MKAVFTKYTCKNPGCFPLREVVGKLYIYSEDNKTWRIECDECATEEVDRDFYTLEEAEDYLLIE